MKRRTASIPRRLEYLLKQDRWPSFTEEQVAFLEEHFPDRCLGVGEPVEVHLRHAGMVELIGLMRANVKAGPMTGAEQLVADHEETWEEARSRAESTKTTEVEI